MCRSLVEVSILWEVFDSLIDRGLLFECVFKTMGWGLRWPWFENREWTVLFGWVVWVDVSGVTCPLNLGEFTVFCTLVCTVELVFEGVTIFRVIRLVVRLWL